VPTLRAKAGAWPQDVLPLFLTEFTATE